VFSSDRAPDTPEDIALSLAAAAIDAYEARVDAVLKAGWPAYRSTVEAAAIELVPALEDVGDGN
jgi:hypothetical protein